MSKATADHTHKVRPKGADKWEPVTAEGLEAIKKQVGERTFKASYQVAPITHKDEHAAPPAALPTVADAAATTSDSPSAVPDEAPVTPQVPTGKKK